MRNSIKRNSSVLESTDWLTLLLYLLLVLTGIALIRSTASGGETVAWFNTDYAHGKQLMWFGISLVCGAIVYLIDPKVWSAFAAPIYIGVLLLLIGVLLFGQEIKGSKSWFVIGPLSFQPAELAKVGTALLLAKWLSLNHVKLNNTKQIAQSFFILFLPIALILLQGDVGSALVFTSFLLVLHREGLPELFLVGIIAIFVLSLLALLVDKFLLIALYAAPVIMVLFYNRKFVTPLLNSFILAISYVASIFVLNHLLPDLLFDSIPKWVVLLSFAALFLILGSVLDFSTVRKKGLPVALFICASIYTLSVDLTFHNVLKDHHRERINVMLGKSGDNWNLLQSKIAIGSGGLSGKGYLQGTQTNQGFVPEQSTDFIFSTAGEEFGFLGSLFIIGLFTALIARIVFIGNRQRSTFTRVYAYSIAAIFLFHYFINIGMTIGLAPVIGIPLPFVSYGGSSLLSFSVMLFLLIRMDTQRLEVL